MDNFKEYLLLHKTQLDEDAPPEDSWKQIAAKLQAASDPAGDKGTAGHKGALRSPERSRIPMIRYAVAACLITLAGAGLWLVMKNRSSIDNAATSNTATTKGATNATPTKPATTKGATNTTPTKPATTRAATSNATTPNLANNKKPNPAIHPNKLKSKAPDEVELIGRTYATLINQQLKKLRSTPLYAENSNYFAFYVDQFKQMDHDEQTVRDDIKKYGLTNEILEQLINVYQQKLNLLKSLQAEVNKMNNKVIERQPRPTKPEAHYLNI